MDTRIKQYWYQFVIVTVFLLCLLSSIGSTVQAQDIPAFTIKPFDNQQTIAVNGLARERWIFPAGSNYIMISYGRGVNSVDRDIVAQQLDQDGKVLWNQVYNLPGQETLALVHIQDQGFVMAVNYQDKKSDTTRLLQIDGKGKIIWQRNMPLKQVNTIVGTNDDGLVIAGTSGTDNLDIHIIKLDKNGDWKDGRKNTGKWEKQYKNAGNQQANAIWQVLDKDDFNDGYILTGYTDSNTNGKQDVYIMRLDAYGEVVWGKNYGGVNDDQGIVIIGAADKEDELTGFLVAGNTETPAGDKNIYYIYVDKYGNLQSMPGYQYAPDGIKERQFGGVNDQIAMALVAVPEGFKGSRKWYGKDIEGNSGVVMLGYSPADKRVLVVRIDERGHVLWQKTLLIPGDDLMMGTIFKGDNEEQDLAYSVVYPDANGKKLEVYTLQVFLEGVLEEDKTIPQKDQLETNGEAVQWKKTSLKYEAMRDISKEIKDLLSQQLLVPQTAISSTPGEIDWPDTSYYLGNLAIGKADGEGTLLFPNGIWYKGAWKNNMFNGHGYLRFPTGENYEGDFKDHMMHGQGVFKWPTGESYRGAFQYSMREGKGVFTWSDRTVFEGSFVKDNAEGQGVIRWPSGERYEGQMQAGNATGQGSYYFPNGEWYKGEISNLTFAGVGVYHWPNGAYYAGEFSNDRLNGEGCYVWPNGVQQWGYWKDDRYIGINQEIIESKGTW